MGSFSLPSKYKVNIVRPVEASQQFQCKGNGTVSMSIHWPVSEMHPSDITQQCSTSRLPCWMPLMTRDGYYRCV